MAAREEMEARKQAFLEAFGRELTPLGFIRHRAGFWRMREQDFVQHVAFHPMAGMHAVSCDSQWTPGLHGMDVLLGLPAVRRVGVFQGTISTVPDFVSRHAPDVPVPGLGSMLLPFGDWLRQQLDLFMAHALPVLMAPCDCAAAARSTGQDYTQALAMMALGQWDGAAQALEATLARYEDYARKDQAAGRAGYPGEETIRQVCRRLLAELRSGSHAGAEELLRRTRMRAREDVNAFSKRLGEQFAPID